MPEFVTIGAGCGAHPMAIVQFIAVMFTVLALVPGGAHLIELPGKIGLDERDYLIVQRIYRGWAISGVALVAALASTLWLAVQSWPQEVPFVLASSAFVLLLVTLIVFFIRIFPVNKVTGNWTRAGPDFEHLRRRWEYGHAINAVLTLIAVAANVLACLLWNG